jgi:hypothetical protein
MQELYGGKLTAAESVARHALEGLHVAGGSAPDTLAEHGVLLLIDTAG